MQQVLHQILHCPYRGLTRQLYLQSKCLELIALRLEPTAVGEAGMSQSRILQGDDVDRIHLAKDILLHNLKHPPSLLELARQVRLNDRKLKQGFRQVFGTTVFGYLHDYRMQQAQQLLIAGQMNVKETAGLVGYASQSSFNAAFKKTFGVNPKALQGRR